MWESIGAAGIILLLRSFDVSLGTMRLVYVVEGRRLMAMGIAFFEASAFVVAVSIVLSSDLDPFRMAGYAAGFAAGNVIGMTLVRFLKLGNVNLRIFTPEHSFDVSRALREAGFRLTVFNAEGRDGPVGMIMLLIRKREIGKAMDICKPWLPSCFVTIGEEPYAVAATAVRK